MDLTDEQWAVLEPLAPPLRVRADHRGRPWRPNRDVLNGILWVLRTGASWKDMPPRYPPYSTCHRRFSGWVQDGTMRRIVTVLANDLRERGGAGPQGSVRGRNVREREKGGACVGKTKRGKGTKIMAMVDRSGLPFAIDIASASPHESTLVEDLLRQNLLRDPGDQPRYLIGDKHGRSVRRSVSAYEVCCGECLWS